MDEKWYAGGAVSMLLFTVVSLIHYLDAPNTVDPTMISVIAGIVGTIGFAQLYRQQRQNHSARSF